MAAALRQATSQHGHGSWLDRIVLQREAFRRLSEKPVLRPMGRDEERGVFNPGVIRLDGKGSELFMLYRADGCDGVSHLKAAASSTGGMSWERTGRALQNPSDHVQLEDPRLTRIEGSIIMTCTEANLSEGSWRIGIYALSDEKFSRVGGIGGGNENNKNGVLFPERIEGKYVMMTRPTPRQGTPAAEPQSIGLSAADDLGGPWTAEARSFIEPREHWETGRVGAAAPPVLIKIGNDNEAWFILYHASDRGNVYRLGGALFDYKLKDQLWRSPVPLLEPEMPWEKKNIVGKGGIVFSCNLIEMERGARTFYGAGDFFIGVAGI
ncbi:MAG: hypothetical protein M1611_02150 [Candidatus Marsarchaeota archaeon]|nr:hypothetical protein [Candidatus Marsarchaeota archaeon]